MSVTYDNVCEICGRTFETRRITVSKFCSGKCRQRHHRNSRSVTVTSQTGCNCVRCGLARMAGSIYCSLNCKVLTNREKHHATFRLYKALFGGSDYDVWMEIDHNWKSAYQSLEVQDYRYLPSQKRWMHITEKLPLTFGDE